MKWWSLFGLFLLSSCAVTSKTELYQQQYYDTVRSISRDLTVSQAACWAAVTEIAKTDDSAIKAMALALAEKCKIDNLRLLPSR